MTIFCWNGAKTQVTARFLPKPCAHQLLVVSSPRPRWFQLNALNLVSKAQALADVPYMGPVFGVSKTSISGFVAVGPHCAQLKKCCRIGGWSHHSGHRAIIFCDNCTQRSAIVFLTPGQLAGQMHAPRIHFKEHMRTEKTRLQHQIWPQKRGQFLDLQFAPFPVEGWFWGPLVGPRNGPRNSAFFPLLLPYHLGLNILASMAAAATILCVPDRLHHQMVYLLKVSLHNHNHMRSTQLLRLQAYTHTLYI